MNRSFFNVILGGFGGDAAAATQGSTEQRSVKSGSANDAAFILGNAETVVIVPGYGLAVARAQHAVKELAEKLTHKGITVKYAIHPVAGRMPGHMNVLLAEAEVPYDQVFEMEDINGEFGQADVAIILGANDVVNPAALQKGNPIHGMPILEAYKAKTVIVNKRSMAAGYAGWLVASCPRRARWRIRSRPLPDAGVPRWRPASSLFGSAHGSSVLRGKAFAQGPLYMESGRRSQVAVQAWRCVCGL